MVGNVPLFLTYLLSVIVMIGLPIFLAFFFTRRFKISWWVVLTGVLTFIASQVLHIPVLSWVNSLFSKGVLSVTSDQWFPIVYAIIIGLLAGIFEETARWVGFKILRKKAEKFGASLAAGIGHGGIESIIICVMGTAATLVTVLFYNAGAQIAKGTSTDQVQYMLAQIQMFWSTPWHYGLLPGVERVIALSTHLFLSALVWKAVVDRSAVWFALAVLYHMVVDGVGVFLQQIGWNYWSIEGVLAIFMLLNIFMLYRFWKEETEIEKEMEELGEDEFDDDEDEDDEKENLEEGIEGDKLDEVLKRVVKDETGSNVDDLEIDHPQRDRVDDESTQD